MDALVLAAAIGLPLGIVVILGLVLKGMTARSARKNAAAAVVEPPEPLPPLPSFDQFPTGLDARPESELHGGNTPHSGGVDEGPVAELTQDSMVGTVNEPASPEPEQSEPASPEPEQSEPASPEPEQSEPASPEPAPPTRPVPRLPTAKNFPPSPVHQPSASRLTRASAQLAPNGNDHTSSEPAIAVPTQGPSPVVPSADEATTAFCGAPATTPAQATNRADLGLNAADGVVQPTAQTAPTTESAGQAAQTAPDQHAPPAHAAPVPSEEDNDLMPPASPAMTPRQAHLPRPTRTVAPGRGLGRVFAQRGLTDSPGPGLPAPEQCAPEQAARLAHQGRTQQPPDQYIAGEQPDSDCAEVWADPNCQQPSRRNLAHPAPGVGPRATPRDGLPRATPGPNHDFGNESTDTRPGQTTQYREVSAHRAPATVAMSTPVRTSRHVPDGLPHVVPAGPAAAHHTTRRVPGINEVQAAGLYTPNTSGAPMVPVGLGGDVWDTADAATGILPHVATRLDQTSGQGANSAQVTNATPIGDGKSEVARAGYGYDRGELLGSNVAAPARGTQDCASGGNVDEAKVDSGVRGVTVQVTPGGVSTPTAIDSVFTGSPLAHSMLEYQEGADERDANIGPGGVSADAPTAAMSISHQTPGGADLRGRNEHRSVQIYGNEPAFRPDLIGAQGWYEEDRKLINPALLPRSSHNGANHLRNPVEVGQDLGGRSGHHREEKESLDQLMSDVRAGRAAAPQVAAALKAIAEQLETAPMAVQFPARQESNYPGECANSGPIHTSDWPYDGTVQEQPGAFLAELVDDNIACTEAEPTNTGSRIGPRRQARNNARRAVENTGRTGESLAGAAVAEEEASAYGEGSKALSVPGAASVKMPRHAAGSEVNGGQTASSGERHSAKVDSFDSAYTVFAQDNPADLAARYVNSRSSGQSRLPSRRSLRAERADDQQAAIVPPRTSRRVDIVPRESATELPHQPDQQLSRRESNTGREHQARRTALKEAQDRRKRLLMEG